MISEAYVFIDGLEDKPVICGVTRIKDNGKPGQFRYGKSYLGRPDAFPLDPINLPLSDEVFSTSASNGLFGALADAGADSWGEKVILSLHQTKPKNKLEFLLAGSGMGVGALVFSLSQSSSKPKRNKNMLGDVPMLLKAKDAILRDEAIPEEAKKAFEYGSSMGGARPKTIVQDGDTSYLAKFNRPDDLFNTVKVEHASMTMLKELGGSVAYTSTLHSHGSDILLVERFDLFKGRPIAHFLSANSLFNMQKVNKSAPTTTYTYGFLAEFIMKYGDNPLDAHDLYKRMAFNVFIGNTDDHSRNHALLYNFDSKTWRLSPAYDVLPINNSKQHGVGIGIEGREGTINNLLSQSMRFGLRSSKALKIINTVKELCIEWPSYFTAHGVGEGDLERLKSVIPDV